MLTKLAYSRNMEDAKATYTEICKMALSHQELHINVGEQVMDDDEDEDQDVPADDEPECAAKGPLKYSTPFGKYFLEVAESVRIGLNTAGEIENQFYCPEVLQQLQTNILPLFPFWSLVGTDSDRPHSNAAVESYFKKLKVNIMRGKTGLQAGDCTRIILRDLAASIKESIMQEKEQLTRRAGRSQTDANRAKRRKRARTP